MRSLRAVFLALFAPLACANPFDGAQMCTAEMVPAIEVEIRDAETGAPLAQAASGVVRDGSFTDALQPYRLLSSDHASLVSRRAADERPGVYSVEVQRAGYRTWTESSVAVGRDRCHVATRTLRANLVPVAP